MWKLDVMGAFCMLKEYQSLFKIVGKYNGSTQPIDNTTLVFPFKDGGYDILKGEINGYTPEAMMQLRQSGQVNSNTALISSYYGGPVGNNGDNICRVRFYIEPEHRAEAEKVCGHSLPDDLFKYNGNGYVGSLGGVNTTGAVTDANIELTQMNYKAPILKQKEVRTGNSIYGPPGKFKRVSVPVPSNYPMNVKSISVHELVSDRLAAALNDIANYYTKVYGPDFKSQVPGICQFDGCYNLRQVRGGSSYSIHSWAIALDFDAGNNGMSTHAPAARLSQPQYSAFIQIMEAHGFMSLGKQRDYDWMHFQAATF